MTLKLSLALSFLTAGLGLILGALYGPMGSTVGLSIGLLSLTAMWFVAGIVWFMDHIDEGAAIVAMIYALWGSMLGYGLAVHLPLPLPLLALSLGVVAGFAALLAFARLADHALDAWEAWRKRR
jgi:O-antigen/teichoic acid export membrane protein